MLLSLNWHQSRAEFLEYVESRKFNARYAKCLISYLDKHLVTISQPMDIIRLFSKLTQGQAHNVNRGIRNFLNFQELKGVDPNYINALRKAIPKDERGYDLNVPDEAQIIASLSKLKRAPLKYQALWNLLLDSGLRLTEACKLINNFEGASEINGFFRVTLGYFRGAKLAFVAYFSDATLRLIQQNYEKLTDDRVASHYFYKFGYVAPKYLRKFAFDTMISEALSVPESVADFIEDAHPNASAQNTTQS